MTFAYANQPPSFKSEGSQDFSSLNRDLNPDSGSENLSPNHWTARELPKLMPLNKLYI